MIDDTTASAMIKKPNLCPSPLLLMRYQTLKKIMPYESQARKVLTLSVGVTEIKIEIIITTNNSNKGSSKLLCSGIRSVNIFLFDRKVKKIKGNDKTKTNACANKSLPPVKKLGTTTMSARMIKENSSRRFLISRK